MQLPFARISELVEQEADGELLVYDLQNNKGYNLNETSKNIFRACDSETSFDDLKRRYQYPDDVIYFALDKLRENNLLEGGYTSPFTGMTRREVVRRVGLASMIALPVISGFVAPRAAQAASGARVCNGGAGTCYAPGENICAGRSGQITRTEYTSTNGSCTGTPTTVTRTCTGAAFRTLDACVTGGQ